MHHINQTKKIKRSKFLACFQPLISFLAYPRKEMLQNQLVIPDLLATKSNKVINITAHETHAQIEQQIGIDKTQPPLRPAELSKIKEQRDLLAEPNRQQALLNAQNRAVIFILLVHAETAHAATWNAATNTARAGSYGRPIKYEFSPAFFPTVSRSNCSNVSAGNGSRDDAAKELQH